MHGDLVDGVFAAVESGDGDTAPWDSGEHGGYGAGLCGGFGCELFGDWSGAGGGGEFLGSECDWSEWDGCGSVDCGGVLLKVLGTRY